MKGRLVALIVPASVAGVAIGASAAAHKGGMISAGVFYWLWPCLVALLWLALGIGALVMRWTKWAWPPLAGFLAQFVGILLLVARAITKPIDVLWISLGTFGAVLLIILAVWLVVTLRTRALERKLVEGGGEGVDTQALARIRKDMSEALAMLRRAGTGRNAIYELPWLLVMGRPQGGKTFAIKNSGLSLPVRKDWVKGAGGTFTADWFFTNEMIFLDTPGKWVQEGVSEEGSKNWTELLRLLRRHRGRRPLDGLVVVVPADDLLSKSADELAEQASHVREVIDLIHDELKFRFPVYLLVSKTDLVDGFVDFFKGLPANRKHQIFGWSHPDPNDREAVQSIRKAFGRVLRRMQAIRLEILARTASATGVRRLFFFTEEFRRLEDPLVDFAEALFASDPYHETPVFRGFYFTSATQGEGAPLGQAMAQLARNLGVRTAPATPGETEAKRSYFLLEMFRTLMVGDEGLVSRTAGHWLRRRRDTVLAAFLPATIAAFLLLWGLVSYTWNRAIYSNAADEIPKIVERLDAKTDVSSEALDALKEIDKIRAFHQKMTGFTLFRGLGMRQPGDLAKETFRIFREELDARILAPTFRRAQEIALDPAKDFATQADAFYSVVWLRQGNAVEYGDDLKGFEGIWSTLSVEDAAEARQLLVEQFEHLIRHVDNDKDLLQGFDLAAVAESLRTGTSAAGSASALKRYSVFQDDCAAPSTPNEIRRCHELLRGILTFGEKDSRRLRTNLQRLKTDLREIQNKESGAREAADILADIRLPEKATEACFATFETDLVPKLKDYYLGRQDQLIKDCRNEVSQKGKGAVHAALNAQNDAMKKEQDGISERVSQFNDTCGDSLMQTGAVDVNPVFKLSANYRRVQCVGEPNLTGQQARSQRPAPARGGAPVVAAARPAARTEPAAAATSGGGLEYFARAGVPSGYNQDALEKKKLEQGQEIEYAKGLSPTEKNANDAKIRKTMDDFGSAYTASWEKYLRSIRLKTDSPADAGAWLQALAQSGEWRTVLEPAAEALAAPGNPSDEYFGGAYRKLASLSSVSTFLNSGLGSYTGLLKRVGQDLARCANNPALAGQFRSAFMGGDAANSLVAAQSWVDQNGGFALAQGSLQKLLQGPLDVAKGALGSSADPNKSWAQLRSATEVLSQRFPFSGTETDNLASVDDLKAVFGGLSGMVPKLFAEQDKLQLSPAAKDWLTRAQKLSRIFFDPGKDEVNTYNIRVTLNPSGVSIAPGKAAESKDFRLEKFDFAMTDRFSWSPDKDMPDNKTVKLNLFGESAEDASKITIIVGERGRKDKWTPVEPGSVVASETGSWAPLKVLAKLKPAGAVTDSITLSMDAPFEFKKKTPPDGKLTVTIDVKGRELGTLLDVIKSGFPPAPAAQ